MAAVVVGAERAAARRTLVGCAGIQRGTRVSVFDLGEGPVFFDKVCTYSGMVWGWEVCKTTSSWGMYIKGDTDDECPPSGLARALAWRGTCARWVSHQ